jgi:MarR-like DNA-binding transcriptional regulator SgrR of sgrS sRNA
MEDYYLRLTKEYHGRKQAEWFPVTMDGLTAALDCTRRNAQLLIRKLKENRYIDWKPGLGRGNVSQLAFLRNAEELILDRARYLADRGQISEALALLNTRGDHTVHAEFRLWLGEQFGIHQLRNEEDVDILRFPFYRTVHDIDPLHVIRRTEAHLIRQIFDTLVRYDPAGQNLKPGLAHHWEHDKGYTQWTFYLRKGVLFHHGKALTANDVSFTYQRIQQRGVRDWLAESIQKMEVRSAICICFELREPNALFAHFIATERFSIVPEDVELISERRNFAKLPVGTGPFVITANNESVLVLEANERYFTGRPFLDRIEMWVWPNYEEALPEGTQTNSELQLLYFEANSKGSTDQTMNQLEKGSTVLTFNLSKAGVLHDPRIRQAIHVALDRQRMILELKGKRQQPSSGFDPAAYDSGYGNSCSTEAAKDLLIASSYAGQVLNLYTYEFFSNEEDVRWIEQECRKIGIRLAIKVLPIRELYQMNNLAEADLIYAGEVLSDEPSITLIEMYRSPDGYIRSHLDPEMLAYADKIIAEALSEEDPAARMVILGRIEQELKRRNHVLFIYHSLQSVGHDRSFHGMSMNAWGKVNYKDVWVK